MKVSKIVLALGSALLSLSAANAGVPNHDDPSTFVGPTAKGSFNSLMSDNTAFSLYGEAGLKNFRVAGTVGWKIDPNQRFKFSGEYLWQNITYSFFNGNSDQWVSQGAIGADYQYALYDYAYRPAIELSGYLEHAPSKTLGTRIGLFTNRFGINQIYINQRRIAGSNGGGLEPGASIQPWIGGKFGLYLNYDNVRYDNSFQSNTSANGFGGTARFNQLITENIEFGAAAAIRRPFNNYSANIAWTNVPYYGSWTLGLFGDYTAGKEQLPNTYNAGISAEYYFDSCFNASRANLKGDFKDELPLSMPTRDDFLEWTSDRGLYIPQVLAIPDQRVTLITPLPPPPPPPPPPVPVCTPPAPVLIGALPPLLNITDTTFVNAATVFSSTGLTFSTVVTPSPLPTTVTINSATGVITINPVPAGNTTTFTVTVIGANACGSTSTSFLVTVPSD